MTYRELLKRGEDLLSGSGVSESRLDAWYLFSHCFSMDRAAYFLKADQEADGTEEAEQFWQMVEKRQRRIPLQQILKNQEFMGLSFFINEHVLIPRQDTETLVETVLEEEKKKLSGRGSAYRLLDLCTGSGCIGLSIAKYLGEGTEIVLSDISLGALRVAQENIRLLDLEKACRVVHSDLFEEFSGERFDCIVSNPPYIPRDEIETLSPEVKDHEPRLALDGSTDGLAFYRRISEKAAEYLFPGGRLYLEIGWDQGETVAALLQAADFLYIEVMKDLAGNDRVVKAERPE